MVLQVFWYNMPELERLQDLLRPRGDMVILRERTLRFTPFDAGYPTMYFNRGGSIDILVPENDLFYQNDCLEMLEQWLGEPISNYSSRNEVI